MPTSTEALVIHGVDADALEQMRSTGIDHGGSPVQPFVDVDGGWPLRCCLSDSQPGDVLAIVAWSPFPWAGPYREVGPIVVHIELCDGPTVHRVPPQFLTRRQIVRPYGFDRRIAYEHCRLVEPDGSLPEVLVEVLAQPDVDFALVRNVLSGCYSFTARRSHS